MCKFCCKEDSQVRPIRNNNVVTVTDDWSDEVTSVQTSVTDDNERELTWAEIASFFDTLMFFGFLTGQIFFSIAYLVPLVLGSE